MTGQQDLPLPTEPVDSTQALLYLPAMKAFPSLILSLAIATTQTMAQDTSTNHQFPPLRHGLKAVFGNNGNDHGGDFQKRVPRMIEHFRELDVDLTRIEFKWAINEPQRGVYDWSEADRLIYTLHQNGIEPMLMFYCPPNWAMVGPPEDEEYFIKKGFENLYTVVWARDEYKADMRRFAETSASRYKGKTNLYEFWNEPDGMAGPTVLRDESGKAASVRFGGDPVLYTEWLKVFYEGVKAGNPEAQVAAGSLCIPSTHFLEAIYASGGGSFFDAISIHPYPHNSDQINIQIIKDMRDVMVRNGDWKKPIWISEFGWTTGSDTVDPVNPKPTTAMDKQASLIRPMFELIRQLPYVTQFYFFTLNDWGGAVENSGSINGFGLVDINLNKKPSFDAYKDVVAGESDAPRPVPSPGISILAPTRPIDLAGSTASFDVTLFNPGAPQAVIINCLSSRLHPPGQPVETMAPSGRSTVQLHASLGGNSSPGPCPMEVRAGESQPDTVQITIPATAMRWRKMQQIDGDLSEWSDRLDIDAGKFRAGFAWDDQGLYLACEVDSPTLTMGKATPEAWEDEHLWKWDSLQLGIDPLRDAIRGGLFRPDDSEYLFASTDKGLQIRRYAAMDGRHVGPVKTGRLAIRHHEGALTYEAFLPWQDFHPGTPQADDILGVSLMVIQIMDGERQLYQWGEGITGPKLPARYASVRLVN